MALRRCLHCRAFAGKQCGRCGVAYCSEYCQLSDWSAGRHRAVCGLIAQAPPASPLRDAEYVSELVRWYGQAPLTDGRVRLRPNGKLEAAAPVRAGEYLTLFPVDSVAGRGRWPRPADGPEAVYRWSCTSVCSVGGAAVEVVCCPLEERPRFLGMYVRDGAMVDARKVGPPPADLSPAGAKPWYDSWPDAAWEEIARYYEESAARANAAPSGARPFGLVAARDIAPGEEICSSFSPLYWLAESYGVRFAGVEWYAGLLEGFAAWVAASGRTSEHLLRVQKQEMECYQACMRPGRPARTDEELQGLILETLRGSLTDVVRARCSGRP